MNLVLTLGNPRLSPPMHHQFTRLLLAPLMLASSAIGFACTPSRADDAAALMGRWRVPPYAQERFRMSDQCQRHADTDTQRVDESDVQVFNCDDPKYAAVKARILDYVHRVNPIYRREGHPLYSENISGLCAVVQESKSERKDDVCNPSPDLRKQPIVGLPVIWNIRRTRNGDWPYRGDSYSPSSGYGAISCFKNPTGDRLVTKGCRRWTVELPFVGSEPCDCGCSMIVCDKYVWQRK
jgi:Uncharacterized protein conserved in bacteria (DUF2147)